MKVLIGKVVSTKMAKTLVVEVARQKVHPLYKKLLRRSKRLKVDCGSKEIKVGDMVKIVSTRPISKEKHYKLLE
jgi:small subunit ribosomal protein S17